MVKSYQKYSTSMSGRRPQRKRNVQVCEAMSEDFAPRDDLQQKLSSFRISFSSCPRSRSRSSKCTDAVSGSPKKLDFASFSPKTTQNAVLLYRVRSRENCSTVDSGTVEKSQKLLISIIPVAVQQYVVSRLFAHRTKENPSATVEALRSTLLGHWSTP